MQDLDYETRPSKQVTRRILLEMMRRLQAFQPLTKYSYVGFGAIQFIDFDLVHRSLGITKLTSIESDQNLIARCNFNIPYRGVSVLEGTSTTLLPSLDWTEPAIVWLDYTQRLRQEELRDLQNLMLLLRPGSVFAVTLNCRPENEEDERRDGLAKAVGEERVPIGVSGARLGDWGLAKTQREILTGEIQHALGARGDETTWQQLLNIHYRDGAKMQLVAGIVDHPHIHSKIENCRFHEMAECRTGAEALEIEIPMLTCKERHALNAKLPSRRKSTLAGISEKSIETYAQFYRWLDPV